MKKKLMSILVIIACIAGMITPVSAYATSEGSRSSSFPPVTISIGGTVEPSKTEYTTKELLALFPSAQIVDYDELSEDEKAEAARRASEDPELQVTDSVPIQRFVHIYDDGSIVNLDVYTRAYVSYGCTLGAKTSSGGTDTWTNTVAWWYISQLGVTTHCVEFYVTHKRTGATGTIVSHSLKNAYPLMALNPTTSGSGWIQYNVVLYENTLYNGNPLYVYLQFNANTNSVSSY